MFHGLFKQQLGSWPCNKMILLMREPPAQATTSEEKERIVDWLSLGVNLKMSDVAAT